VEELPTVGRPTDSEDLIEMPEPEMPLVPQPLELPEAVEELPNVGRTSNSPSLVAAPRPETPEAEEVEDPPEAVEPNSAEPAVKEFEAAKEPTDLPLTEAAGSPTPGTDLPNMVALTVAPTPGGQIVELPEGEARGSFTISPEGSLDTTETEPGLPGVVTIGDQTGPSGGMPAEGGMPSAVTISFGSSGAGEGEGSGTGSGTGPGPDGGSASGSGSGPGEGPFSGITTIGGFTESETSGSSPGSDRSEGPLSGFTVIGGVEGSDTSQSPIQYTRTARPLESKYGWYVVSTEEAGGGLPYVGVFSQEQIHTVYLDMRQSPTDTSPFWPLEFAVPREIVTRRNLPDEKDESDEDSESGEGEGAEGSGEGDPTEENDENEEGEETAEEDDPLKGFVLPATTSTIRPALPPELVSLYTGKVVVVFAMVNAEGKMEQLSVKQTPDPRLNETVLDALRQWVFRPGLLYGVAVPVKVLIGVPLW
jgi:hypothetical protein